VPAHHPADPRHGEPGREGRDAHRRADRRLRRGRNRSRRRGGRARVRGRRRRRQRRGSERQDRRGQPCPAQVRSAGAVRAHPQGLQEGADRAGQIRPRQPAAREGAGRSDRTPDGDPLLRSPGRPPVRPDPQCRRGSPLARAQDHGVLRHALGHAASALHQGLPRQRNQPRVGRQGNRRQEGLLLDPGEGAVRGEGAPGSAHRDAGSRRHADQEPQGHQQADVHRRSQGAPRQARDDRGQPAPGDLDRQEVHQPRPAVPRPDPGRQHRPDEGGGQVRIPSRLQVLDLRHLVDPPGDHPLRSPTRRAPSASRCT